MSEQLNKADFIAAMQREYQRLEEVIGSQSEAQLTLPGAYPDSNWTIKDTVAHLTAWMRRTISRLPGHTPLPDPIEFPEGEDLNVSTDRLNAYYYEQNRQRPLGDVLSEFRKTYREIRAATENLTEEQLQNPDIYNRLVGNTFGHYREHLDVIEPWLEAAR